MVVSTWTTRPDWLDATAPAALVRQGILPDQDLQSLQCPLRELGRASPYLLGALKLVLTAPFDIDTAPKLIRGDYMNASLTLDTTLSAIDNAFLTGTGLSGALRALEQSFGRDPETMIPDVRYTPNPNDAPGGPLVERADRQC